ncbi:MAG: transcription-repair coupling factor, partial [Pseudomonadota bacterium]
PDALYINENIWHAELKKRITLSFNQFGSSDTNNNLNYHQSRNFTGSRLTGDVLFDDLRNYTAAQRANGRSTIIACYTEGSRERIASMLHEHEIHPLRIESAEEIKKISGKTIGLAVIPAQYGFANDKFVLITEQDLLGERIIRATKTRKKNENFLSEAANLIPSELVVHKEHGIGRFEGLVTLEVLGALHDCLKIIYDGDAKLFLPVENIDLVSRYGTEEEGAKLDKLGSASWQARKAKLKERINLIAEELIKTAAGRELSKAPEFSPPTGLYDEFCARFPYTETEDQARAIEEVLTDLDSGRPTDRLICGDVGFGKTEVALRAAFVAASNNTEKGKVQVAVICPTTLLCRQHYHTFAARFAGMPFNVRQISRLSTAKENKITLEGLENGSIDIVIGTHSLLSNRLKFKNLGLLVIDEEQHFGVTQKEKLKSLKSDIHVITLSATPIPRTLQLALSGVRELSIIATPPVDRLAVRSFVTPFDPVIIREAIMREYNRGGKIFYVTPRIQYMAELQKTLSEIAPEIRIATAHGQMSPSDLDDIMNRFYDGAYDMLLSTTIVESGLDIPTANTIIIDHAEMLGLSQLYQLRGRVGRGKTRAYAYFTLPHKKQLTHAATRRLEVMQTLDSLGAGFTLASHDMDIRGFGNLLGDEQSGHVREVGIELYQQMLEDAVFQAKNGKKEIGAIINNDWSPQINLGMSVLIPEIYVEDLDLRLGLYRRAAALTDEMELDSFAAELIDRFGKLPEEAQHFIAVMRIKQLCRKANIERIDAGPKGIVITFHKNIFADPDKLIAYVTKNSATTKIRPDQKLFLAREFENAEDKLKVVSKVIGELVLVSDN